MSNVAKLVVLPWMHNFSVPKLGKWFRNEINHSTPLDPNDVWECFGAFRNTSARQTRQNLCFRPKCTISGYMSCENSFATKSSIMSPNDVWECFRAFCKPLACQKRKNLCFVPECTISGYRSCETYPIRPQTMFESVSEHFANLWHVKRGKTSVSGLNTLFWVP